ncbi:MAG: hypothetical protein ACRDS1_03560 [Pseudonocardiaceae bacterium]
MAAHVIDLVPDARPMPAIEQRVDLLASSPADVAEQRRAFEYRPGRVGSCTVADSGAAERGAKDW